MSATRKLKLRDDLVERAALAAASAGFSSVEEFVEAAIEQALRRHAPEPDAGTAEDIERRMKGLGYM